MRVVKSATCTCVEPVSFSPCLYDWMTSDFLPFSIGMLALELL